jgi:outer membrane protein TolC
MMRSLLLGLAVAVVCGCALTPREACEKVCANIILPEQRSIDYRDPAQFPAAHVPATMPPRTVSDPRPDTPEWPLSLDEAIRIALENAQVIRVLAGTTATASGQTIYDAAIVNTTIDQAQATFDPVLKWNNLWSRTNTPMAELEPKDPTRSFITSTPADAYKSDFSLNKTNVLGGQWSVDWTENPTRFASPGIFPLNPENPSAVTLSYTQPLLQGAGFQVNTAPIVIARLNTEQSFFQFKDSVQELVRGVIEAYWNLVQARVNVWARKIQVDLSEETFKRESARLETGVAGDLGTVAQAKVSYYQFLANLTAAQADVLTREGALRNLLYLPPEDNRQIIPTSVPVSRKLPHDWDELVRLAEQRRPDIIELKIITEADQVRLVQARSQALPRLDATALYRWNGLSGEMPNEEHLSTHAGQFMDWSVGVNFSVPLGLRQGRAQVRQQELIIARDQANVDQDIHLAIHQLASTLRDLDSAYEQYRAFKITREAAATNVRVQNDLFKPGLKGQTYLNVLQALNDWGTAVSSESQQLLTYNIALAALERQTGTILDTHGLVFYEERFKAAGPLGILGHGQMYPYAEVPAGSPQRYPGTGKPSENAFDLTNPAPREEKPPEKLPEKLPPPAPLNEKP